jgi:hypothetical protein
VEDELEGDAMSPRDARLLAALGEALGSDRLPAFLVENAEELIVLKDLDSALVELLDQPAAEPVGMRGGSGYPLLQFEAADGSVAVELAPERDRLVGQVLAGELTGVALESRSGVVATATVDELGRFSFDQVTAGPARLRLLRGAAPVTTDWFLL